MIISVHVLNKCHRDRNGNYLMNIALAEQYVPHSPPDWSMIIARTVRRAWSSLSRRRNLVSGSVVCIV